MKFRDGVRNRRTYYYTLIIIRNQGNQPICVTQKIKFIYQILPVPEYEMKKDITETPADSEDSQTTGTEERE